METLPDGHRSTEVTFKLWTLSRRFANFLFLFLLGVKVQHCPRLLPRDELKVLHSLYEQQEGKKNKKS